MIDRSWADSLCRSIRRIALARGCIPSLPRALALSLTSAIVFAPTALAQVPLYGDRLTTEQLRFGASAGSASRWQPQTSQTSASAGFGGRVSLTCSGLNYSGFLKGFDVKEFVDNLKNQFIAGAQAEAMAYLMTLAYSNPTVASVLDTMDQSYQAKFSIFQSACNAQEAKQRGQVARISEAEKQCYENEVNNGTSPNRAIQVCANESTLGSVVSKLPAGKDTLEFLKGYTNVAMTPNLRWLLKLIADEQVTESGHQVKPPEITLHAFNANVLGRTTAALNQALEGRSTAAIRDCNSADFFEPADAAGEACVPMNAAHLIQSPAFHAARQLSPQARKLYVEALASQVAMTTIRGSILDLASQIKKIDAKAGTDAQSSDVVTRKKALLEHLAVLEREADALAKLHLAKAESARTQMLALDLVQRQLAAVERVRPASTPFTGLFDSVRTLFLGE